MAITFTETKKKSLEERLADRQRQAIDRANALKESAYSNRLAGIGLEDNPSAAKVHGQRELTAKTGPNGRTYLYDKEGNITVGTDFQRAMAPDEYRKLETEEGRSEVYAPEKRVRGVSYVGSQQLDPRELAMKARERALDRAGMTDMKAINKALQMRRNIRSAMEAESGPSAAQREVAKRWNLERTFGGTHGAKARVAQMGIDDARRQAERDQALTLAILGHDKDRDVAKLQNEGNLAVETQRGTNAVDLAKQQGADNVKIAELQSADAAKVKAAEHVKNIEKRSNDILTLAAKFANKGAASPEDKTLLVSIVNSSRLPNDLKQALLQNPDNTNLVPVFEALIGDANRYRAEIGLPPIQFNSASANNIPSPIINI